MSNTGLYSGLYSKVRDYAELLDNVLIHLKSGTSCPSDIPRQRLGKLLVAIEKTPQTDFSTQLLSVLVREFDREFTERWSELGEALLSPNVPHAVIDQLERLALRLERERSSMVSAMRGRGE
jgi:hypothetical protein